MTGSSVKAIAMRRWYKKLSAASFKKATKKKKEEATECHGCFFEDETEEYSW
jgi:hypothetical protein